MAIATGSRGRGRGVGGERCSTVGCTNKAQASGRCRTHTGTLGQCSQVGCEKQAQYRGLCVAHGGRRVCTHPGCSKTVTSKGLCGDHGGGRRRSPGSKRTPLKQETATRPVLSHPEQGAGSMMSLLLNEWPQDSNTNRDRGEHAPIWTEQDTTLPHEVTYSTWTGEVTRDKQLPQSDAPIWTGEHPVKLTPLSTAAVVPATSSQGSGSMMSLLLGAWSHEMELKTEETSVERDLKTMEKTARARKRALCTHEDCTKIAQSQGLCVSHGGKRCTHPGCIKSAQYQGLCTTHGGSRTCTYPGCAKTIRSAGRCFEHGGGKQCSQSDCTKQAQSNGLHRTRLTSKRNADSEELRWRLQMTEKPEERSARSQDPLSKPSPRKSVDLHTEVHNVHTQDASIKPKRKVNAGHILEVESARTLDVINRPSLKVCALDMVEEEYVHILDVRRKLHRKGNAAIMEEEDQVRNREDVNRPGPQISTISRKTVLLPCWLRRHL
ncbi:Hypothetical protein PHPALM_6048 [Phytophthora palmivora]|uniref:WRKY19-like zinc finger domain-containing protein n=1 Tax=Phytophthora palmivora TaxID=4796 RepID=A0A2P4YFW1_9STRA|nr:Hypothetical protein PHPALM_6048 [Phytophthora palmivora]